ncbi:MAG TPA: hypothetical protein VFL98_00425 [Candidatus Paceibacterota bacterium]|nr:hypothetical protein [Candidatus Paceibacterota bacterium]
MHARVIARLRMELGIAAVYRDAGLRAIALETYRNAAAALRQQHTDDVWPLYEEALMQIDALER